MLDIIDMAELMFGDVGCYQINDTVGLVAFYMALLMSAFLTTSNSGLEQEKDEYDLIDCLTTLFSLVFNDAMFFGLRLTTIIRTKHAYFGAIFLCKEILSSIIRACMVVDNVLKRMRKDYHEV